MVIKPDGAFDRVGDVMVEWLTTEGYDVVPLGGDPADISDLLGSYLEGGMNLIAFRLTKGNDEGTIRPIRITYASDKPMIPIRPTAVAANDDMGVMVWALGESRAVPVNYRSLQLNEALLDWLTGGSNYNQVVVAAANEAGGQGFVTERAGGGPTRKRPLRSMGWVSLGAFMNALMKDVIAPMLETEALLGSRPYVTRLYTTLSAPEMDLDPLFDFNEDLEDVTNVHSATRVIECSPFLTFDEAPSRVELEDGRVVRLPPGAQAWPFSPDLDDAPPANAIIAQLTTSGPGTVVTDNRDAIDNALSRHNAQIPTLTDMGLTTAGGCAVGQKHGNAPLWPGLGLAALLLWRRRRAFPGR